MELKILLGMSTSERDRATNSQGKSVDKHKVPLHTTYGGVELQLHAF
jgi:hypothetical protein